MNKSTRCIGIGTIVIGLLVTAGGTASAEVLEDDGAAATSVPSCSANQLVVLEPVSPMARRRALALIGFEGAPTGLAANAVLEAVQNSIRSTCE